MLLKIKKEKYLKFYVSMTKKAKADQTLQKATEKLRAQFIGFQQKKPSAQK